MIKILHLSDIHMGSGFSHGRMNPETGQNTRLEDFAASLRRCIDRALAEPVDLVLFGGDAFPDATPPPFVQEVFAAEFRRLADGQIPTVLLVGNHDQHSLGEGGASLCIYRTLGVPGFIVGDRLATHRVTTRNGPVQIITLPWLTRSTLLTRPETEKLTLGEINHLLIERLTIALKGEIMQLNPEIPTVLLGHLMADNAEYGAERYLAVGKGFTIPLSLLTQPEFDYVALGHVHRHQNLNKSNNPPVVYPGSIERVDFSEEKEEKGYILVELQRGEANWQFCPLPVRPFKTIKVDISEAEEPQKALLTAIHKYQIQDAVVRLVYQLRPDQIDQIDNATIHQSLKLAHTYSIQPELVSQQSAPRLPELGASGGIDPLEALQAYLGDRVDLQDIAAEMLAAAETLISGETWTEDDAESLAEITLTSPEGAQLRLL
ncbi:MAG: exonuclease subunit SbcD [Oscillatoriaceae cyanobacterium]